MRTRNGQDAECHYLIQIDFKLSNPLAGIRNVNKQPMAGSCVDEVVTKKLTLVTGCQWLVCGRQIAIRYYRFGSGVDIPRCVCNGRESGQVPMAAYVYLTMQPGHDSGN